MSSSTGSFTVRSPSFRLTLRGICSHFVHTVKSYHGESTTRSLAILASLQIAILTSPDPFPDVDFVFRCTDNLDPGPRFGLTKARGEAMFLLPDFGFESCTSQLSLFPISPLALETVY